MGIKRGAASFLWRVVLQGGRTNTHFDEHPTRQSETGCLTALRVSPDRMEVTSHPIPTEINGKSDWEFQGKQLKTVKFARVVLNYRRDIAPEIISLLMLRDEIHLGPRGLLTMPRYLFLIKSSQTISQRANPWCAVPPTLQELIRLNKPQPELLDHISKLQWSSVKWLRLRQLDGIKN